MKKRTDFYNDATIKIYYSDKLRIAWFKLKFWNIHAIASNWWWSYWDYDTVEYKKDEYIHIKGICILGLLIQWRVK